MSLFGAGLNTWVCRLCYKHVNFQTEQGGELGQPDWNFGLRYKICTLVFFFSHKEILEDLTHKVFMMIESLKFYQKCPQNISTLSTKYLPMYLQILPTKTSDSIVPYEVSRFLRDGSSKTTRQIHTKILQLKIQIFFFKMRM